jgi:hypothetical protein
MSKLVQQYVKTHEVSQPCGLVCRLFVKEDLTRCPGPAVDDQTGVEVLGLPQLDHAQPIPRPNPDGLQHLPHVTCACRVREPRSRRMDVDPYPVKPGCAAECLAGPGICSEASAHSADIRQPRHVQQVIFRLMVQRPGEGRRIPGAAARLQPFGGNDQHRLRTRPR